MFSSIFIAKPKMAMVISLVLVLLGFIGYVSLPVAQFPDITPPVVSVNASYPGANAETVEATVAAPIEAQVNGVDGMIYMSSSSDDTGGYSLSVSFAVGTDPDIAAVNVQNRVAQAMASLPTEVTDGGVVTRKDSPGGTHDEVFLSNYASINLRDALSRVNGVGEATVLTDFAYAMRIWLDPQRMASLGMTPGDIVAAIRDQNLEVSAGQIGSPPVPGDQQFQYTITAQGRLTSAAEFGNIVVRHGAEGGLVRIRDVARVELGSSFYSASGRFSGNPATVLAVYQAPGANALSVAKGVKAELERLSDAFPEDVRYVVPYDSTLFVEQSLNDVIETLVIAFVLVISVVFVFLGSWRATVIPAVAIPVSLIGTFAVLMVLGMSLNTISLFALVLAIGIVVDDAIIVVENVESIMAREGLPPAEATRKAMVQITGPVIATTLVLLAVFVPVLFMPGITGRMFSQFAITISAAVVISSINALTLSPALCALLLRPRKGALTGPLALFERGIDGVRTGYVALVRRIARVAVVSVVAVAGIVVALVVLTDRVPAGFLPDEDNGVIFVDIQLPDAASLNRTETVSRRLEAQVLEIEGVADTVLVNGFSLLGGMGSNGAMIIVTLDPWDARTTPAIAGQEAAASVLAFNPPPIPGLGMGSGVDMMVQQTGGGTAQDLAAAVGSLVYATNQQPEIAQAYSTFRANVPKFFVEGLYGVVLCQRFQPVRAGLPGDAAGRWRFPDNGGRYWRAACAVSQRRDGAAWHTGRCGKRARPRAAEPLQHVPRHDRDSGARPRLRHRRCDPRAGGTGGHRPAPRLRLRMDGHGAATTRSRGCGADHPRAGGAVRLPVPRRAIRKLDDAGGDLHVGDRGAAGGCHGGLDRRRGSEPLYPDRDDHADRPRRQERDPDRRIRHGTPRGRHGPGRRRAGGCKPAVPRRDDDGAVVPARRRAAADRVRRRGRKPARAGNGGVRGHAGRDHCGSDPRPASVHRVAGIARTDQGRACIERLRRVFGTTNGHGWIAQGTRPRSTQTTAQGRCPVGRSRHRNSAIPSR